MCSCIEQDGAGTSEAEETPTKGRRGSAGRPKVSRIMKDVQEGEALLKVSSWCLSLNANF